MEFAAIPGLSAVKKQLIRAVQNNAVPHAQLFSGAQGALTLPLALAYASYLHCTDKNENGACARCPSCHKNKHYIHPDTCFIFPSSNIKSDTNKERLRANILQEWRAFLQEQPFGTPEDWINYYGGENKFPLISRDHSREIAKTISLKPFESTYKLVLIWQPEHMHPTAANAILKILEEPAPGTVFILASNAAEQLLPTIRSRLQTTQVPLLADNTMSTWLQKEFRTDKQRINIIVQLAEGNLSRARQLATSGQDLLGDEFITWMRACFKEDYRELIDMSEQFHKTNKLAQQNRLHYANAVLRETILCLAGATTISRTEGEQATFIQNFSRVLNTHKIEQLNRYISTAQRHLNQNGSAKMIFLNLSTQYAATFKDENPTEDKQTRV